MTSLAYILIRTACFLAGFPNFFGSAVPGFFKAALALAITLFLASVSPLQGGEFSVMAGLGEAAVGLGMGFCLRLCFLAFRAAGDAVGFTVSPMASMMGGVSTDGSGMESLWGHAFTMAALLLFFAAGGPEAALQSLAASLKALPAGSVHLRTLPPLDLAQLAGRATLVTILLCLPPLAASLLAQWGMAIVLKVAPQIQLFAFAMPAGGMAALWVLSLFVPSWPRLFDQAWSGGLRAAESMALALR